jgi:hypothetical protein
LKRSQQKIILVPQWNKRWFSIERHLLKWYATPMAEKASGVVDLRFVTDIASFEAGGGVYSFVLSYPDRNLLLRAPTQGDMEKWMRALQYQADIVRGGDGTNIVTDTNSFCLSPQGKGRAIKGKYRPPTLEATVEAALNRLQVLESQVNKKAGGGGSTLRARSMFEVESGARDYIRPDDVALNDLNSKRGSKAPSRGPSTGKLNSFFGDNSHSGGGGGGGGGVAAAGGDDDFDDEFDSGTDRPTVIRMPYKAEGKQDTGLNHHQQQKQQQQQRQQQQLLQQQQVPQQPPLAQQASGGSSGGGRDRKHSIEDDLQSIEEINALPVPRFRKSRNSSMVVEHRAASAAESATTHVDDGDGDGGTHPFSRKPPQLPQSWRSSSSHDFYDDDGSKGSGSVKVFGDRPRHALSGKADPSRRASDVSVLDAHAEDEELRAVEEDLQEVDLTVVATAAPTRRSLASATQGNRGSHSSSSSSSSSNNAAAAAAAAALHGKDRMEQRVMAMGVRESASLRQAQQASGGWVG